MKVKRDITLSQRGSKVINWDIHSFSRLFEFALWYVAKERTKKPKTQKKLDKTKFIPKQRFNYWNNHPDFLELFFKTWIMFTSPDKLNNKTLAISYVSADEKFKDFLQKSGFEIEVKINN